MELTLDQALQRAVEAHKAGQIQEAERLYTAILKSQPNHPDANHNMGVLAVDVDKVKEALPFFKTALEANPKIEQFWLSYIDALIKSDEVVDTKAVLVEARDKGIKGEILDQLEQKLNAQTGAIVNVGLENSDQDQKKTNILDSLKLDQALRLAKKKVKEESLGDANRIYDDILAKFPKNKKAIDGIKSLSDGFTDKISKVQDPSQDQIQPLINLYQKGQLQQALDSTKHLLKQFPNSLTLYNIQGVANAGLSQFDAAIDSYKQALKIKPDYADAYYNMGTALNDKGDLETAVDNFKQAIKIQPNHADAYYNMGNVLNHKGDFEAAIKCFEQALKIQPDYAKAYNNMGNALKNKGNLEATIDSYKQAIKIKPEYAEAYNNMGNALNDKGDKEGAIDNFKLAIKIKPHYYEAHNNLGNALNDKGDIDGAIDNFERALKIKPDLVEAYNNMGVALKRKGDLKAAVNSYQQAIKIDPNYAEAYSNMGVALMDKGNLDAAINCHKQALEIKPEYAEAYNNMGAALKDKGDIEAAIYSYKQAIKIKPNYAEAYSNMGVALMDKGDLETAMDSYKRAIKIEPKHADAHINKAFLHLRLLDFEAGWLSYEWRWKRSKDRPQFLNTSKPLWQPSMRQRVLLWGEQGLGDEIMFASLILDIYSLSSKLIVQTDKRLINLFKRSFPNNIDFRPRDELVSETEYDAHMPLGSAPIHFRQTIESFKDSSEGWLSACSAKTKTLRSELLSDDSETLIGISWHTTAHRNGAQNRLIPLNRIAQMLHAPKVRLVSLQYGDFVDEVEKLSTDYGIKVTQVTQIDNMNNIDGLAALINACDRIVSIDNATVHLAGALGKDTKVLLPYACEWRWGQSSQDSYWYDSVQLYRQIIISDWEHVIKNYETLTKSKPAASSI